MDTTYDYLITQKDTNVLKNISQMGLHLQELKEKMLKLQAEADLAKQEYEHYANNIMPTTMHAAGIESLELSNGKMLSMKRAYYCSPNKNEADQKTMIEWLKAQGGDFLIKKSVATTDQAAADALTAAGIAYAEQDSVNTASLKSFIKDKLGITSGVAQINIDDIPKCIHFQEVTTIELN